MAVTSCSAIKDAFITNLSAASVFGPGQVDTNYAVMESTSACCCVVSWASYSGGAMSFGNPQIGDWSFLLEVRLKDTGNPITLMNNAFTVIDNVLATLRSDDTLQGVVNGIGGVEATRPEPGTMVEAGGAVWLPIDVRVTVQTWD